MPIKELVALSATILGGIFITHPFDFPNAVRQVEFSILKEMGRTNSWGNPSLWRHNRYTVPHSKFMRAHRKAIKRAEPGT
jgi:hypothetical protein